MELRKYLGKGIWGLADKALPVVYGLGFVLLVIRVLPEEEFGNFVLVQEIFLIITGLATALALQPLLKFASEQDDSATTAVGSVLPLYCGFLILTSLVIVTVRGMVAQVLNAPALSALLLYLPGMLAASLIRNLTLVLLQARFRIKEVFWVDALHFLGAPFLVWVWSRMHRFDSALDLILINICSLSASSLIGLILTRFTMRWSLRATAGEHRKIWDYGKFSAGGVTTYLMYSKADTFLLSAFAGPVPVAVYNAAKVFTRVFEMLTQVVQMFVLPATSRLSSRRDGDSLQALVEKSITFSTIGMLPVLLLFLLAPGLLIGVLYGGRYADAIPILQIFAGLALGVPLYSVGSNVLLGLGEAKANFHLGLQMLFISLACYIVLIPPLGAEGAALAYVAATVLIAISAAFTVHRYVPLSLRRLIRRERDIRMFILTLVKKGDASRT